MNLISKMKNIEPMKPKDWEKYPSEQSELQKMISKPLKEE